MGWRDQLSREKQKVLDLNQAAGTYDLFTATGQDIVIEGLLIRMPNTAAGGALTSISIQSNDSTAQIFISASDGIVANLTAEAQLAWASQGAEVIIAAGKKIQLTIAGGATGVEYLTTTTVKYHPLKSGGYLA